eukprot:s4324_g2.t1
MRHKAALCTPKWAAAISHNFTMRRLEFTFVLTAVLCISLFQLVPTRSAEGLALCLRYQSDQSDQSDLS